MFTFSLDGVFVVFVIYMDDILLPDNNQSSINALKHLLDVKFSIKDLETLKYYLKLEISRTTDGVLVTQDKFIHDLLASVNLLDCKPLSFPIDPHIKLFDNNKSGPLLANPIVYRACVVKGLYLNSSRPDTSFSVQMLSQYLHTPREKHIIDLIRVFASP